jgi:hypothetical protein
MIFGTIVVTCAVYDHVQAAIVRECNNKYQSTF